MNSAETSTAPVLMLPLLVTGEQVEAELTAENGEIHQEERCDLRDVVPQVLRLGDGTVEEQFVCPKELAGSRKAVEISSSLLIRSPMPAVLSVIR